MTREEQLTKLQSLRFCVFWPESWEDIGFTERPIWVNSLGYGYYPCDEPCTFLVIDNINDDDIKTLKDRLEKETLTVEWVKDSPFYALNIFDDDGFFDSFLDNIAEMPDHIDGRLFCGEGFDGWQFYSSEEELIEDFDKKDDFWGGEAWIDMDDNMLSLWYERIFGGIITDYELPITLDITE